MDNITQFAQCIEFVSQRFQQFHFTEAQDLAFSWAFTIIGLIAITGNAFAIFFFTTIGKNREI